MPAKDVRASGIRTAWLTADEAAKELGELVDVYLPARVLIMASSERLLRKR
jgi:hypothetical protein